jgi:hypothetical protein
MMYAFRDVAHDFARIRSEQQPLMLTERATHFQLARRFLSGFLDDCFAVARSDHQPPYG